MLRRHLVDGEAPAPIQPASAVSIATFARGRNKRMIPNHLAKKMDHNGDDTNCSRLFPFVNHCHLPFLAPGVKEICRKHGADYNEVSD